MQLEIACVEGLRNDLTLRIDRKEVEAAYLSVANRQRLMALPGIVRHRGTAPREDQELSDSKIAIEEHIRALGIVDAAGVVRRRAVAISNRNLGTNHGHLAWQRSEIPHVFHVREDPCDYGAYSCLTVWRTGELSIEDLRFDVAADRVHDAATGRELSDEIEWATFGQRVLRNEHVARAEDIAHEFYDIRHVLAFDAGRPEGARIRDEIYRDYPAAFRQNVQRARAQAGVPRARYVHNAIGLSADAVVVIEREGTIEEVGRALASAGARDGLILDNGGSVACWVWWANAYRGGVISPTVDYRPPGTSAIALVLKGPARIEVPGGSISPTVF